MGVKIINRREMTATTEVLVSDLQELIAGLEGNQRVEVKIDKGFDGSQFDYMPPSVTLAIENPRPAWPSHIGGRPVETL